MVNHARACFYCGNVICKTCKRALKKKTWDKFGKKMWLHIACKERMLKELKCTKCGKLNEKKIGSTRQCVLCGDSYCQKCKSKNMKLTGKLTFQKTNTYIHEKCQVIRDKLMKSIEKVDGSSCPKCHAAFDKQGFCSICEGSLCSNCTDRNWIKVGSGMIPRFMHKECMQKYETELRSCNEKNKPKTLEYVIFSIFSISRSLHTQT